MLPTINIDTILSTYQAHTKNVDPDRIRAAYEFAADAHEGQYRRSGEPYIQHCLHAAYTLSKIRVDEDTIIAALLHDVPEDTMLTIQDVKEKFGHEVAYLVNGVTKLSKVQYKDNMEEHQVESLRKMFLVMAKDIRVVLIKLADRLHNMETLGAVRPEKRLRIAKETIEIFAPLADRMGIWDIKWRLEDLCFRYIFPVEFNKLREHIQEGSEDRAIYIKTVSERLEEELRSSGIIATISGRTKHLYSIYKKMSSKRKTLDEIYDLFALRIIVNDVKDCYAALGIVHDLWRPKPGRFKDYIAVPKPNGYQSLHTTVFCMEGKLTEFQIRTHKMHEDAEYGVAAHWHYNTAKGSSAYLKGKLSEAPAEQLGWVRNLMELHENLSDSKEFIEGLKIDIFKDRIFVFTPLGDVKDLPAGSTCVDFAYAVHTDLGHKCVGAKINGSIVPIETQLNTGDVIEIITTKTPQGPKRDWLKFVITNHARNKIRGWFRNEDSKINVDHGLRLIDEELQRIGKGRVKDISKQRIQSLVTAFNTQTFEGLLIAIGDGSIRPTAVIRELFSAEELMTPNGKAPRGRTKVSAPRATTPAEVIIQGERNMPVRYGQCCKPQAGKRIVGFITRGRGITIHDEQCPSLKNLDHERMIHASWSSDMAHMPLYKVNIVIEGNNRVGLLRDILATLSDLGVDIHTLNAHPKSLKDPATIYDELTIQVTSFEQLEEALQKLGQIFGVQKVFRKQ